MQAHVPPLPLVCSGVSTGCVSSQQEPPAWPHRFGSCRAASWWPSSRPATPQRWPRCTWTAPWWAAPVAGSCACGPGAAASCWPPGTITSCMVGGCAGCCAAAVNALLAKLMLMREHCCGCTCPRRSAPSAIQRLMLEYTCSCCAAPGQCHCHIMLIWLITHQPADPRPPAPQSTLACQAAARWQ
jgi:hypothetical protein